MRLEVILACDIGVWIASEVVLEEYDGHDEGNLPVPVFPDYLEQLRLVVAIDLLLEKTHDML